MKDAHIFPHATGEAAKVVKAHENENDGELIFYSGWFCPFNQRVWAALEEKGLSYKYVEINPYLKSKEFLAINPKGLVPAIEHGGIALYESTILLEYLDEAFPDSKPLLPPSPKDRALARIQIDYISKKIIPTFFKLVQFQDQSAQDDARTDLVASLKELTEKVKGPFYAGEEFGAVDICLAPFLVRFYVIAEHRGFDVHQVGPKFVTWFEACTSRPSIVATSSDKQHYTEIYERYLANEAESEMAKSTRGEKAHV